MKPEIKNLIFGLLLLVALSGRGEPVYTLNDCIRIGLERAVPVQNAERDRRIAKARIKQARSQGLPQITLLADYTYNDGESIFFTAGESLHESLRDSYSASITGSQPLYSGGKVFAALRAAKAYRNFTEAAAEQLRSELTRDIHLAFNRILLAQEAVTVQADTVRQLEDFAEQAKQKYDVGAASEFDHLTAQVRLANEQPKLIEAQNALELAKRRFRNLIYLDEPDFELRGELAPEPFEKATLDGLQLLAETGRKELYTQDMSIIMRRADLRRSQSAYLPTLSAEAVYSYENPDRNDNTLRQWEDHWQAGLVARWTLFGGGLRRGETLEKGMELAKAQAERDTLLRGVRLEVTEAWLAMQAAEEILHGTQQNVELAERALEIARTRYDEGLAAYIEFTDSNLALATARLTHFQALEQQAGAVVQLKYAAGILKSEQAE